MESAEQGVKQFFLTRFRKIRLKSGQSLVKIWSKSLEIMCFHRYNAYPDRAERVLPVKVRLNPSDPICVRPHLPSAEFRID